ncbi:SDR family NAD(P)-dependent oxidoreductase [Sciscionella sediminilitoris]|uniref:SDR family NAD(P)-dependent oxidoreductase n=1 Tax=Sciscionella sediminilitoris TaxID=1445613 RepID=UPI0004DEF3D8|nr:SDR family oxidoreductase [Sciscionella sp. SE31]
MTTSRICVVTGAGRGIGRAVAHRLSNSGHQVVLTARTRDQLAEVAAELPGPSLCVPADVTDPEAPQAIRDQVAAEWGPIEVAVLAAGTASSAPLAKTTDAQWRAAMEVNLDAPFRFLRALAPGMAERGWGRIVVIASMAAKHGDPYVSAYTASKHGVLGLVRATAAELARSGVTVNAVCPGFVDTPMTEESIANISATTGRDAASARAALEARQPIRRLISAGEVAEAVEYCVASAATTGQGINVDGGAVQS